MICNLERADFLQICNSYRYFQCTCDKVWLYGVSSVADLWCYDADIADFRTDQELVIHCSKHNCELNAGIIWLTKVSSVSNCLCYDGGIKGFTWIRRPVIDSRWYNICGIVSKPETPALILHFSQINLYFSIFNQSE